MMGVGGRLTIAPRCDSNGGGGSDGGSNGSSGGGSGGGSGGMAAASASSSSTAPAGSRAQATHFLLYLNQQTYTGPEGEALAAQVRDARKAGMQIAMVHENDADRNGCDFATFFQITPKDLVEAGLYNALAIAFVSGETHRKVSRALLAKALGATDSKTKRGVQDAVGDGVSGGARGALRRQLSSFTSFSRISYRKKRPLTVTAVKVGDSSTQDAQGLPC
uniref:Uncharacterized protein n=1 Tax=Haptolina ericina TaxID=156174 RepID=A0A7S3FG59_9EUKA